MQKKIGIIGLGYVGLPLAMAFSKKFEVIGFDIDKERVDQLNLFEDKTNQAPQKELKQVLRTNLTLTSDPNLIVIVRSILLRYQHLLPKKKLQIYPSCYPLQKL